MENNYNFKPFDKVLVRDRDSDIWQIDLFESDKMPFSACDYACLASSWEQCIPYEGNEHLHGTTDKPEMCNTDRNTLFGIKLKSGYVLEFEDEELGVLFPTANGFAVSYVKGMWQFLEGIKKDSIVKIFGITRNDYLRSGELLWQKPQKQIFTKAEIAEKLCIPESDFEIIEEDNEENE